MLVMTTIFTSKIEELPPTSDMKIIGGNGWEVLKLSWNIISHQKDLLLSDTQNQVPLLEKVINKIQSKVLINI